MTNISLIPKEAPELTNLQTAGNSAGTGISVSWEVPADSEYWLTEVWASQTNDRSTATLAAKVVGTTFIFLSEATVEHFFWIRSVNIYGSATGKWFPLSSAAGVSGIADAIVTEDIAPNAVSDVTQFATTTASTLTAYDDEIDLISVLAANKTGAFETRFNSVISFTPTAVDTSGELSVTCYCKCIRYGYYPIEGFIELVSGSPIVTGTGTNFIQAMVGQTLILAGSVKYTILSVENTIQLTLAENADTSHVYLSYYITQSTDVVFSLPEVTQKLSLLSGNLIQIDKNLSTTYTAFTSSIYLYEFAISWIKTRTNANWDATIAASTRSITVSQRKR